MQSLRRKTVVSTVVTLKIIKVALSEGIRMNLNLSVKALANPGCPGGDTPPMTPSLNLNSMKLSLNMASD